MRKLNILAFDDFIMSATTVYTSQALNEALGAYDKLTLQAVADSVAGTSPTLKVQIETSSDQRNWAAKSAGAEIPATAISSSTNLIGGDTSAIGSLGFVRLAITLAGTTPSAHVKVWVTARDTVA